jgi:hypothetical protein
MRPKMRANRYSDKKNQPQLISNENLCWICSTTALTDLYDMGPLLKLSNVFINQTSRKMFSTSNYFSCQIKWLNIFLVRSSSYRQINLTWKKKIFLSILRGKYCLIHLKIVKRPKKWNYNVEISFKTR